MEEKYTIAYKHWLESLQEPAPEGNWDAIADRLDIDQTWDNISEELDLDDVWHQVQSELPAAPPLVSSAPAKLPRLFWPVAALLLLTLTTPFQENGENKKSISIIPIQEDVPKTKPDVIEKINDAVKNQSFTSARAAKKHNGQTSVSTQKFSIKGTLAEDVNIAIPANLAVVSIHTSEPTMEIAQPEVILDQPVVKSLLALEHSPGHGQQIVVEDSVDHLVETDSAQQVAQEDVQDSTTKNLRKKASWRIGIVAAIQNTWLINPETTNGMKSNTLVDTKITYGKDFGVTVEREIGTRSFLQAEYYFISEIGQRYQEYINALYQTKDITLKYQKVQLVYRRQIYSKISILDLYVVGGIRVSKLTVANSYVGGEGQVVTNDYSPWDYGVLLGGESEFNLDKKLILVSGIRASYGIRNIYIGDAQSPGKFNKTHTATIALSLGVKYRIH